MIGESGLFCPCYTSMRVSSPSTDFMVCAGGGVTCVFAGRSGSTSKRTSW
eukprot:m.37466 g.37466  ORF g.37466 m.37466 type:complete len:50 (-) comp14563_c0_seq1:2981-3130(-)